MIRIKFVVGGLVERRAILNKVIDIAEASGSGTLEVCSMTYSWHDIGRMISEGTVYSVRLDILPNRLVVAYLTERMADMGLLQ